MQYLIIAIKLAAKSLPRGSLVRSGLFRSAKRSVTHLLVVGKNHSDHWGGLKNNCSFAKTQFDMLSKMLENIEKLAWPVQLVHRRGLDPEAVL